MIKKIQLAVLMLALTLPLNGCFLMIGAAAGGGTAIWFTGRLTDNVEASYAQTIRGVERALNRMDLLVLEKNETSTETNFKSRYDDGSTIWIDVMPVTKRLTKIQIRVGVIGDEPVSRKILDNIKKSL